MNEDRTLPYRCIIRPEECQATLKLSGSSIECQIVDLSREDFQIRLPKGKLKKIQAARQLELRYQGERWLVSPIGKVQSGGDTLYFQRVEELTKTKPPSPWASVINVQLSQQTDPRFIMALMVAFIFACLALPGLGDKVGTAPKLKKGIHSVFSSFK